MHRQARLECFVSSHLFQTFKVGWGDVLLDEGGSRKRKNMFLILLDDAECIQ